jgi:Transposase DNA-binding
MERAVMVEPRKSFGARNFGEADLGDDRRTRRLPKLVDEMARHPGGTLPQKLPRPEDLEAFYRLCDADDVTHDTVMAPHRQQTLQFLQSSDHFVLAVHDATELDYTTHSSLKEDLGQIGNGNNRGYLAQNTLVVDPQNNVVVGLANQILHVRAQVAKGETQAQKRDRDSRESLLWLMGTQGLPARREVVDVCDRGADTFEFIEHEVRSGRTFVIRSAYDRSINVGHEPGGLRSLLHTYVRTLPELGSCDLPVTQKVIVKKPKKTGKKTSTIRTKRLAHLSVTAAPVLLRAPSAKNGHHGNEPVAIWIVRIWESNPPAGEEALEWLLITNYPVETINHALLVKTWYEWRWTVEELHKAMKTGCGIESLCFQHVDRLQPAIGILSILALTLLALRDAGRNPQAKDRLARHQIDEEYIEVLSLWRHRSSRSDWTQYEFYMALARLGGHSGRKSSPLPGWLVLWRGWEKLQLMIDGARVAVLRHQLKLNKMANQCA